MIKTTKVIKRVAFFGDADVKVESAEFKTAVETACLLANNGYIIVNGGGPGIMLAATLGAKKGNGNVELSIVKKENVPGNFEGSCKENIERADKIYEMANYENRMNKLVEIADAYVIFTGGTGTLAEVGLVWSKAKFDYGKHEPIIFVGQQWEKVIKDLEIGMNYENKEQKVITVVDTEEEVLNALKQAES